MIVLEMGFHNYHYSLYRMQHISNSVCIVPVLREKHSFDNVNDTKSESVSCSIKPQSCEKAESLDPNSKM